MRTTAADPSKEPAAVAYYIGPPRAEGPIVVLVKELRDVDVVVLRLQVLQRQREVQDFEVVRVRPIRRVRVERQGRPAVQILDERRCLGDDFRDREGAFEVLILLEHVLRDRIIQQDVEEARVAGLDQGDRTGRREVGWFVDGGGGTEVGTHPRILERLAGDSEFAKILLLQMLEVRLRPRRAPQRIDQERHMGVVVFLDVGEVCGELGRGTELHTLGNHWNYSHRHPKEYDKWKPSLYGITNPAYTDLKNKQALNNSYDNSILYTDWMLSQVIDQLKKTDQITSMLYVSDHGQTLYDNSCNLAFHGHNTQYEFHIPVFMWFSEQYKNHNPEKIAQLYKHKKAKLSTENIFHSLLDLADIRYPNDRLDWSFLSPSLKPHIRYVDSYGWTNYDDATFKGDCREVMDKKTPLVQEK